MTVLHRLVATFLLAAPGLAQSTPQLVRQPDAVPTLRAQVQLVAVDVVVTDRNHKPVPHLTQSEFLVSEDKSPQTLKAFDEHTALTPAEAFKSPVMPTLKPGTFTDLTPTRVNSAANILLLDILNTPLKDQIYVHQQILNYIKKARPGTNTAVFVLTSQLHLLQGFTSDPEVLRSALKNDRGGSSSLLEDPSDNTDLDAGLQSLQPTVKAYQQQLRTQYTLDGFNSLARYLANIPGRKNLIWFSGAFPLDVLPDGNADDPFVNQFINEDEYRDTTNLLAQSQVAVYPVDSRGLQVDPAYSAAARHPPPLDNPFSVQEGLEHTTMARIAEDTGGQAFYNTNDLASAVDKAIDNGSNYYSLAYSPSNSKWRGDYRNIKVTLAPALATHGYTLAYRRGYYANKPDSTYSAFTAPAETSSTSNVSHVSTAMLRAMAHGLPQPQQILYIVRILPASATPEVTLKPGNLIAAPGFATTKGPFTHFAIDFAAEARNLRFSQVNDKSGETRSVDSLEFVALVYDANGEVLVANSHMVQLNLTRAELERCLRTGVPFHLDLDVPVRGAVSIRTGIHELATDRVAAVELPLAAVKNLPPVASSPAPPLNPRAPAGAK